MSKERELLQRILDTDPKFLGGRFIAEIQELLAQPEQTEPLLAETKNSLFQACAVLALVVQSGILT